MACRNLINAVILLIVYADMPVWLAANFSCIGLCVGSFLCWLVMGTLMEYKLFTCLPSKSVAPWLPLLIVTRLSVQKCTLQLLFMHLLTENSGLLILSVGHL